MFAINVHFDGIPGPEPIRYLGVFDDEGNALLHEEWREIAPGKWVLRISSEATAIHYWDETSRQKFFRVWRQQAPGLSFHAKLSNVLQSMRERGMF